jgi:Bacterial dipeptidyl-peptidase Sh3 domain/NlpC/P60 family
MLREGLARDPRLLPVRDGIAAEHLKGVVPATHYAPGERRSVIAGSAALRNAPESSAEQVNQALFGESFTVYDEREGWAWGQLAADHYVGWMRADELGEPPPPTHRIRVLRSFIFEAPNIKAAPLKAVSMNALLALGERDGGFIRVLGQHGGQGWVFARHVSLLEDFETDFVDVASRFVGSPYLWGGRESAGIDCSGLVQVSLQATGRSPLRDSDMQEKTLGEAVTPDPEFSNLKRGDLIFWRGHVGIMESPAMLLHASARDLHVEIEPLAEAIARIRPIAGEVRAVRRLA